MVAELNGAVAPAPPKAAPGKAPGKGKISRGEPIGADHVLGDILAAYPETEKVFRKYYGEGCFSCPGQATESVQQSAMMHDVSTKQLLAELNQAAGV
jgi:hybrid cluster-associated redox disulfide protein